MASPHRIQVHAPVGTAQQERQRSLQQISDEVLQARVAQAFAAGRAEGLAAQLESGREALESAAVQLERAREAAEAELPEAAVELAVAIASELLAIELKADNYDLERMVRGSLASSGVGRGECIVHVCPSDAQRLAQVPFRSGTVVESDPSLKRGEVQVSTARGLLVRELEAALEAIREQLMEQLG